MTEKLAMRLSKRGFTLAELLLAAAILVFVLSGLLLLFINCLTLNESNRNLTIAISHAQYAMEEIKNTAFASIQNATWDSSTISSRGLTPLPNESVVITVNGADPLDIITTVNWKDRGARNRSMALETLITKP